MGGLPDTMLKKLWGARFLTPSPETDDTHAIGRGTTNADKSLYDSIVPKLMARSSGIDRLDIGSTDLEHKCRFRRCQFTNNASLADTLDLRAAELKRIVAQIPSREKQI